ncbi:hypothetical protein HYY73_02650, partial [Candidatus Woesearchaeota archaeon]|nr:hypothetical protein [Candidatus Woesearchaeota archaeon]
AIQLSDGSLLTAEELAHQLSEGKQPYALAVNPDLSLSHSRILRAGKAETQALALKTNGGKTITVSAEHPFLTISESGISWKHARELSERSFIATARRLEAPEQLQQLPTLPLHYAPTKRHSNVKTITLPEFFNGDFAEWCGYMWSEGYISSRMSLAFTNSEEGLIKRFAHISKNLFGLETHIRHFPHKNTFVATVNSATLIHALELLGWGQKIPDIILKSPHSIMRSFLRAYFDGDGSATKRGFEVTTKNHFVALQLQSMLLRFGITPVLRKRMCRATNSAMQPKPYTALMIYDTHNLAKLSSIGFSIPRKMERLLLLQGKKPQSNIDKVPHIGKLIFELKEKLRLTSEDIGIGVHQFQRYLQGTRTPTLSTVQKATKIFSQRFVALRTVEQSMLADGSLDIEQLSLELGISKAALSQRTGIKPSQIRQALSTHDESVTACVHALVSECVTEEVENKLIGLYQLASADVVWERITKITDAGVQELYDFEAENTHNFLANNIFVHNSMMGMAMAELLPKEKLVDVVVFANPNDENQPLVRVVPAGKGRDIANSVRLETGKLFKQQNIVLVMLLIASLIMPWWAFNHYSAINPVLGGIMFMAFSLFGVASLVSYVLFLNLGKRMGVRLTSPKVIVDNFNKRTASFYDATGAHAGALLGDVLHDPFQSFMSSKIYVRKHTSEDFAAKSFDEVITELFTNHKDEVIKNDSGYEALHIPKNMLFTLGETDGAVSPVEVLSVNRYDYDGELIKLRTSEGNELAVTPEHKITVLKNNKIEYVEARELKQGDIVAAQTGFMIIDEEAIITTYDSHQQEQCRLYYQYQKIKAAHPGWGYKRIAKVMNQPIGKTRWWHEGKHIPTPLRTVNWLVERGLLPLAATNQKLPLIAKVLGATFGDGGIFNNLNGIFLSSSEKEAVEEFGKDLENIFGLNNDENSRIIEGGVYGHSWCYQNTNRNIIRFFLAVGAPKGNKTDIELKIPKWILLNQELEESFYGSFLGGELGSPSQHIEKNRLTGIEVGIVGKPEFESNRLEFLAEVSNYLSREGISTGSIYKGKVKGSENSIYRLIIRTFFDNVLKFMIEIKLNYCKYKADRLYLALGKWANWKKKKYYELIERGYGAEQAMQSLHLTPTSLYLLLNHFGPVEKEAVAV